MSKIKVVISYSGKNFCAHVPKLIGCVATGNSPNAIKKNIQSAIDFHIDGSLKYGDPIPKVFKKKDYELIFIFDAESLLTYYKGVFTKSALMRLTGINQQQLHHYSKGLKKPRQTQIKKIENALHKLGNELLSIEFN